MIPPSLQATPAQSAQFRVEYEVYQSGIESPSQIQASDFEPSNLLIAPTGKVIVSLFGPKMLQVYISFRLPFIFQNSIHFQSDEKLIAMHKTDNSIITDGCRAGLTDAYQIEILPHRVNTTSTGIFSMQLNRSIILRAALLLSLMANLTILSNTIKADSGSCGGATTTLPFTDVQGNIFFCHIAAAYFSGLTAGTSATTFSPSQNVTREQMAAFTTRTLDQSLKRGSQRAVAKKWWTPQNVSSLTRITVGCSPQMVEFDGTDLWVANSCGFSVMRIRPSDGKVLGTWTGAPIANGIVTAMGKIFITGQTDPGSLYMIDPTQPAGTVTTVTSTLGNSPRGIAFDGSRIWTANAGGSVSIVTLNPTMVATISTGFHLPVGMLYDGANMWVTDAGTGTLLKLDSNGSIAQTINVGSVPGFPVFDGTNIWVPNNNSATVTVVRVKDAEGNPLASAFVLATLTGNGLQGSLTAAFDGERILVTNRTGGESVSLWKAADLTPLGSFPTGADSAPWGACSDGLNFWITLPGTGKLARL